MVGGTQDEGDVSQGGSLRGRPLLEGEPILLLDDKERKYLLRLRADATFQYHHGTLPHSDLIGAPDGSTLFSSNGSPLVAMRPRLTDYILKMRRGAQIVYPKDIGAILMFADIFSGMTVVEAGTGSGALTMALTRAVGPTGRVVSCELRQDHANHGHKMIRRGLGEIPGWLDLRVCDVAEVMAEVQPDRLVLDLAEPWQVIATAAEHLRPGGVACFYLPTVPQLAKIHSALEAAEAFIDIETFEILLRTWNVKGRSVRPDHSMVGHTGFITVARRITK